MPTFTELVQSSLSLASNHPEAILLWLMAGAFLWFLVSKTISGDDTAPIVFVTFMILGLGFLIGGLIYDPAVSQAFRDNILSGFLVLLSSTIAGAFVVPLAISLVIGWGIGYINK